MDALCLLCIILTSIIVGVFLTLISQWYMFNIYIMKEPYLGPSCKPIFEPFSVPKKLLSEKIGKESAGAINAVLQFIFQECRNMTKVRQWFRKKLSFELEDLLTKTTTGKLFESITLRDLHLGSHLPGINSVEVKKLDINSLTKLINEVEICLGLDYSGGFQISVDANMRLSKTAHVSVKVVELNGLLKLTFTRHPYTHWSVSFYDDPHLELLVESQFQGRQLQQVNNIIASQIQKALKRKHTFPHYNIRYKPFFINSNMSLIENLNSEEIAMQGYLEVTVIELTRLKVSDAKSEIFCNLALESTTFNHSKIETVVKVSKTYPHSSVIEMNESFIFGVNSNHQYLNFSIWSSCSSKNLLLGYFSLPIMSFCSSAVVGHRIGLYTLLPPNPNSANSCYQELASHPGFQPSLCFGDVLLAISFSAKNQSKPKIITTDTTLTPITLTKLSDHNFMRKHFTQVIQCGFCCKKIWLKNAFQCELCRMICHKKCIPKCELEGQPCPRTSNVSPEITTTPATPANDENHDSIIEYDDNKKNLRNLISSITPAKIKRIGSTGNLVPTSGIDDSLIYSSKSLPQSPNRSPQLSRKTSLDCRSFLLSENTDEGINEAVDVLMSKPQDENLLDFAKSTGKQLFANLPPKERKIRLDEVMAKLKDMIDAESQNHCNLYKDDLLSNNEVTKATIAFLIRKSEERMHALSILMLHCCAGLQDSQECLLNDNSDIKN